MTNTNKFLKKNILKNIIKHKTKIIFILVVFIVLFALSYKTSPNIFSINKSWNPTLKAYVYDINTKVSGKNTQLRDGCNSWSDKCWEESVKNGTVKFISTSATMTDYNNRPIVFAYFKNSSKMYGQDGLWNYLPIYADDGSLVGPDIFGGDSQEIDWVYGTNKGIIVHIKEGGVCAERSWDKEYKTWYNKLVNCPK